MTWTPEAVDTLRILWIAGHSAGHIAQRFCISRSAVIGKVHRLGLSGRNRETCYRLPIVRKRTAKPPIRERRSSRTGLLMSRPDITPLPLPAPVATDEARVALVDLEPHHCRFPVGDPVQGFCGHPKVEGLSYCEHHVERCYTNAPVLSDADRERRRSKFKSPARIFGSDIRTFEPA